MFFYVLLPELVRDTRGLENFLLEDLLGLLELSIKLHGVLVRAYTYKVVFNLGSLWFKGQL